VNGNGCITSNGVGWAIPGSTMDWNASQLALPPGWTLTNASTNRTYFDSSGLLQTAGANVARFSYNPATLALRGLMVEQAATNLALDSRFQSIPTYEFPNNSVLTANQTTYLDGQTVMASMLPVAVAGAAPFHYVASTNNLGGALAINANTEYCVSIDVKRKAGTMGFRLYWVTAGVASGVFADFNITTGVCSTVTTIGTGSSTGTPVIENMGGGIYRCSVSGKVDAASTGGYIVPCATKAYQDGSSFTPNGTDGFYICGWQIETGNAPTSRIATTTTSVTRNADVLTATTSGLLVNAQGFAAMRFETIVAESNASILSSYNGSEAVPIYKVAGVDSLFDGSAHTVSLAGSTFCTVGTVDSVANTWNGTSYQGAVNGINGSVQTQAPGLTLGTTLRIGNDVGVASQPISMYLKSLRLGVAALTANGLSAVTR